jgi:hypothetical protein
MEKTYCVFRWLTDAEGELWAELCYITKDKTKAISRAMREDTVNYFSKGGYVEEWELEIIDGGNTTKIFEIRKGKIIPEITVRR